MFRLAMLLSLALLAGCAAAPEARSAATDPQRITPADADDAVVQRIRADKVGFLREVFGRSDALDQYRLTFYRQERLGLIPRLGEMEEIRAAFRRKPFSVRFEWPSADAAYFESVYVAGQNNGKLIVRERKGALLGLPPTTRQLDPDDPVKLGRSKNPITDFGLARVAERTLLPFNDPATREVMKIEYEGLVTLEPTGQKAHYFRIERPPMPGLLYTRQDFYVDAETLLPAGTDLYLENGELDARYRYAQVDPRVNLTDDDFRLTGK